MINKLAIYTNIKHLSRRFAKWKPSTFTAIGPVALIDGFEISKLNPLKPRGFAKSGNISLSGDISGARVKVSSMFSARQVPLRCRISKISDQIFLPRVIANEGRMIVEEWIDGHTPSGADCDWVRAAIRAYLACEERFSYGREDICDFDYLDYLEQRVSDWHFIEGLSAFMEHWRAQRAAVASELRLALCNPDLSFENFVIEKGSKRLVMVDTEFLHVGSGFFMDHLNSVLRHEPSPVGLSPRLALFASNSNKLREIGSALIVGRPERLTPLLMEFHGG